MGTLQENVVSPTLLNAMNPPKTAAGNAASESEDRFMKLLVAQMKNQDPLNPLDNAEITSQLAQLSTVTGIDRLNKTLEAMMGSTQSSQALQAASMIGRSVLAPGSTLALSDGQGRFGIEFSAPTDSATVTIRDASGRPARQLSLGPSAAGTVLLSWDGTTDAGVPAANGPYTFGVTAKAGGQDVSATGLSVGQVTSVSGGAQGPKLNVQGLGALSVADVREIL